MLRVLLDAATSPDAELLHWLTSVGATGLLGVCVLAFLRGWVVPKGTVDQMLKDREDELDRVTAERNRLLELALASAQAAERAVTIAHDDRRHAGTADAPP